MELEPQREAVAVLTHEVDADEHATRSAWSGAEAHSIGVNVDDIAPTVHVDAHRVHVIEGVLALGAQQRVPFPELPAVEQAARVELGHQVLLGR